MPASAKGKAPAALTVSVPIFFHVITSGTTGNLTDTQLQAQVTQMNRAYSGSYGGPNTGFSFALAGVDRTNNATWYASKGGGAEHAMKTALKTGGDNTMNVYTTSGGGYLGYAYLPEITNTAQAYLDGIVIDWKTVPGRLERVRRPVRRGRHARPRGRPLAEPRAHVLRPVQQER